MCVSSAADISTLGAVSSKCAVALRSFTQTEFSDHRGQDHRPITRFSTAQMLSSKIDTSDATEMHAFRLHDGKAKAGRHQPHRTSRAALRASSVARAHSKHLVLFCDAQEVESASARERLERCVLFLLRLRFLLSLLLLLGALDLLLHPGGCLLLLVRKH